MCARFPHNSMLVLALVCGSEALMWKKKEKSRIRVVKIDNLRGMQKMRMIDRMRNEVVSENVLKWHGHVGRINVNGLIKRILIVNVSVEDI